MAREAPTRSNEAATTDPAEDRRPDDVALAEGTQIGRFITERLLGRGGMGAVYLAFDPELGRKVALKLLNARDAESHGRARLLREAQALARLSHPNVVVIYDVGTIDDQIFLAMEYVPGVSLAEWQRRRPGWRAALAMYLEAGRGLAVAHAAGIVHRDFKPQNVLVGDDGRPRVLDFGLARAEASEETSSGSRDPITGDEWRTVTGSVVGTPGYMPPEQRRGGVVDARGDQFSFCVSLHEALHGERPFDAEGRRRPAQSSGVPTWLQRAVDRGLATDPEERYPSMDQLLAALSADPARRRRRWLLAGAIVAPLLAAGLLVGERLRAPAPPLCRGAERLLDGVWDPPRRSQVEAAFAASDKPFAAAAWTAVARDLDGYAAAWAAKRTEVCEATRMRSEQSEHVLDLRIACLDQRRTELGALSRVLAHADANIIARGAAIAGALQPLAGCDDVAELSGEPAPTTAQAAPVLTIRSHLADVRALHAAGRYGPALALAGSAYAQACAVGFAPVQAEAMVRMATLLYFVGDKPASDAVARDSIAIAEAAHADEDKARAWMLLAQAAADGRRPTTDGHADTRDARAALGRLHHPSAVAIDVETADGFVYLRERAPAAALERFRQALALSETISGPDSGNAITARGNVAIALGELGRTEEMLVEMQRALDAARKVFGDDHPTTARSLANVGDTLCELGRCAEGLEDLRPALAVKERLLGPEHVSIGYTTRGIGHALRKLGRPAEAVPELERSVRLFAKLGADNPELAESELELGLARLEAAQAAAAKEPLEDAIRIEEKDPHPNVRLLARGRFALARVLGRKDPRAQPLARDARAAFVAGGKETSEDLTALDAWMKRP